MPSKTSSPPSASNPGSTPSSPGARPTTPSTTPPPAPCSSATSSASRAGAGSPWPTSPAPKAPRALAAVLGLAVATLFCLANLPAPAAIPDGLFVRLLLAQAVGLPLLLLPALPLLFRGGLRPRGLLRWRGPGAPALGLWAFLGHAAALLACCWALADLAADGSEQDALALIRALTPGQTLALIPLVCGLTPLLEELLFRAVLPAALPRRLGLLLPAALFALAHGPDAYALPLFLMGLWLGLLTQRQRALLPAILLHALFNLPPLLLA